MHSDAATLQNIWIFAAIMCAAFTLCLLGLLISLNLLHRERRNRQRSLEDSMNRSRAVLRGQVSETFAPLLPGFPFNHKDARFLGQPVDYLVFDGLSDEGSNKPLEIVLVEIKTGTSALSKRESAIQEAVRGGRVRWMTLRMDNHGRFSQQ